MLEGINSRLQNAEEWINELEYSVMESSQAEQQEKKKVRIGIPEEKVRDKGAENLFEEIIAKIQETQKSQKGPCSDT